MMGSLNLAENKKRGRKRKCTIADSQKKTTGFGIGQQPLLSRTAVRCLPIEELDQVKAFPTFLKDYLSREHTGIEHIVTDDRI